MSIWIRLMLGGAIGFVAFGAGMLTMVQGPTPRDSMLWVFGGLLLTATIFMAVAAVGLVGWMVVG